MSCVWLLPRQLRSGSPAAPQVARPTPSAAAARGRFKSYQAFVLASGRSPPSTRASALGMFVGTRRKRQSPELSEEEPRPMMRSTRRFRKLWSR